MFSFLQAPHSGNGSRGFLETTAGDVAEQVRQCAAVSAAEAKKQLADAQDLLKTSLKNHPALTLGAALAAGVLIGWLIKRR
jgi:hypothetical protein